MPASTPAEGLAAQTVAAALTSRVAPDSVRALPMSVDFASSGVQPGWASNMSAAIPDTTGAAMDVPPRRMYSPSMMQVGHRPANALSGARVDTMCAPGATTSGLTNPSWVTPRLDQSVSASSHGQPVPWSSTAPTESANGSLAGA